MFATLPLSYCTNVHPGLTVDEVCGGLVRYTRPLREAVGPIAAGLWLADPVTRELEDSPDRLHLLTDTLGQAGLVCYTLNAFPQGNFHSEVVKQAVYRPTWADPERLDYTLRCARLLAAIMPDGVQGSLSTVPLGYRFDETTAAAGFEDAAIANLLACVRGLDDLHDETGRVVRLAIEPEPHCLIETTDEAVAFFGRLHAAADDAAIGDVCRDLVGLCFDVCHQAVEFEDVVRSIRAIEAAGIRINKAHLSCAIELSDPRDAAARAALAEYVEPRYLHQTFAQRPRDAEGEPVVSRQDLTAALCEKPPPEFAAARRWRTHYHVPVDRDRLGPLRTTRPDLSRALAAIRELPYAPHLEIETYTWTVLPGEPVDLVAGLAAEVTAVRRLLDQHASQSG